MLLKELGKVHLEIRLRGAWEHDPKCPCQDRDNHRWAIYP